MSHIASYIEVPVQWIMPKIKAYQEKYRESLEKRGSILDSDFEDISNIDSLSEGIDIRIQIGDSHDFMVMLDSKILTTLSKF